MFDIVRLLPNGELCYLPTDVCDLALRGRNLEAVPLLYRGPYNRETVGALVSGKTTVGESVHLREGVVIRSAAGGTKRKILKAVSPSYLTRKGGTEYQ